MKVLDTDVLVHEAPGLLTPPPRIERGGTLALAEETRPTSGDRCEEVVSAMLLRDDAPRFITLTRLLESHGVVDDVMPYAFRVLGSAAVRSLFDVRREELRDQTAAKQAALEREWYGEDETGGDGGSEPPEAPDAVTTRWQPLECRHLRPLVTDLFRMWYGLVVLADRDLTVEGAFDRLERMYDMKQPQVARAVTQLSMLGFAVKSNRKHRATKAVTLTAPFFPRKDGS